MDGSEMHQLACCVYHSLLKNLPALVNFCPFKKECKSSLVFFSSLGTQLVEFVREESGQYYGKIHLYLRDAHFMGRRSQERAGLQSHFWQYGGKPIMLLATWEIISRLNCNDNGIFV